MARPTRGSIYRRGPYYWLRYMASGVERRISLHTSDRKVAEAERERLLAPFILKDQAARHAAIAAAVASTRAAQATAERPRLALPDVWQAFLTTHSRPDCGDGTLAAYAARWRMFTEYLEEAAPEIKLLGDVTPDHAAGYVASIAARQAAAATVNLHVNLCRLVCGALAGKGAPEVNPFATIKRRDVKRDATVKHEFTAEHVEKIMALLDDPASDLPHRAEWGAAFALGCHAGCRLVDAVSMTWDCIDLAPGAGGAGWLRFMPTKTRRKAKWVQVPIADALAQRLRAAAAWRRADDPHVTPELASLYARDPAAVDREADQVIRGAGIVTREHRADRASRVSVYGFHSCRYFFVSQAEGAGVPENVVSQIVGHGSPAMTRHYARLSREYVAGQWARMNGGGTGTGCPRCQAVRDILAMELDSATMVQRIRNTMTGVQA